MDLATIYIRAKRGIREDAKLYVVAISTLTVAFLCLATALLGVSNLVFWEGFVAGGMLVVGYVTTAFHGLFVALELIAGISAPPSQTAVPLRS